MPAAMTVAAGSAWSVGASILTFAFPMILFIAVAAALFVAYTKPSVVPGHPEQTAARPIGFTPTVHLPDHPAPPATPAASGTPAVPDHPAAPDDPAPGPGGAE